MIAALERHGHLSLTEETQTQLLSISAATVDRILRPRRQQSGARGISTTRAGALLKHQAPVRTFADWSDEKPGLMDADLVAHCGRNAEGPFLYPLALTDIATGWTECLPLLHESQEAVLQAITHARQLLPFPLLGLDTDNGKEFLNAPLLEYCRAEAIPFTRGRAYKKNDQCFVEQKNGVVVRQLVGYDRFEGQHAYRQLMELYRAVRLYVNFFQPSMKLCAKQRDGAKVSRKCHAAQTPFQRLLVSGILSDRAMGQLEGFYQALDPVRLLWQRESLQDALWQHALVGGPPGDRSAPPFVAADWQAFDHAAARGIARERPEMPPLDEKAAEPSPTESAPKRKRKYQRSGKPRVPHTWRTRQDPFEEGWEELQEWLAAEPERTAKSLFQQLQVKYPDRYPDGPLRTLQRRVKAWRKEAILTFQDGWVQEELLAGAILPGPLRAAPASVGALDEVSSQEVLCPAVR